MGIRDLGRRLAYRSRYAAVQLARLAKDLDHMWRPARRRAATRWHGGERPLGPKVCVFALYQRRRLDLNVERALAFLRANGYSTLAVNNGALGEADRARLARLCDAYCERPNVGRDFGAFKEGVARLEASADLPEYLLLLNDSVYFPTDAGSTVLRDLEARRGSFRGVYENYEKHYHIGSFFVLVTRQELAKPWFFGFWRQYKPFSSRRWAIARGEVALSKWAAKNGASFDVLYSPLALAARLRELPDDELVEAFTLLGKPWVFDETPGATSFFRERLRAPDRGTGEALPVLDRTVAIETICESVERRNQSHSAGLLFHRFGGAPLLKRDMVYRGAFSMSQFLANCRVDDPALLAFIEGDLRSKGIPASLRGFKRWMYSRGHI